MNNNMNDNNNKNHNNNYTFLPSCPNDNEVLRLLEKYQINNTNTNTNHNKQYTYGTAGFRYIATELSPIMVRVGIMISLYAMNYSYDHCMGIMITASHNDESYNGCKIVSSPNGDMLNESGEVLATYIVNERNNETLWSFIKEKQKHNQQTVTPVIHIGRDTREHSITFHCLLCKVIRSMGCDIYDHGIVTTPILHHCVKHYISSYIPSLLLCGRPYISGYYDLIIQSYCLLYGTIKNKKTTTNTTNNNNNNNNKILYVDCACGVGYSHIQHVSKQIQYELKQRGLYDSNTTHIVPYNAPNLGPLNIGCGSEYVQKEQMIPKWYEDNNNNNNETIIMPINNQYEYAASFDGDADRIVFFYTTPTSSSQQLLHLLDGDKMSSLIVQFIKEQIDTIQQYMSNQKDTTLLPNIRYGVVQTSYANGSSTKYIQNQIGADKVLIAKTGVKYVHHVAIEHFDIGIYFESNGHGTIIFQSKFYQYIYYIEQYIQNHNNALLKQQQHHHEHQDDKNNNNYEDFLIAYQRLRLLPSLVNQAVGDSISDLLFIDIILHIQNSTIQQWNTIYTDLPSKQCKVIVPDRNIIIMNDNETQCIKPIEIQNELNILMKHITNESGSFCRTFIRPSGTEDVVRIYAEASTTHYANILADGAMNIVTKYCNNNTSNL